MNIRSTVATLFVGFCLVGCAASKMYYFTNWDRDQAHWNLYELNGVQFSVPAELPRVPQNAEMVAFCLSGFKSDGYLPGPYVPSDAVYVFSRMDEKMKPDDMKKSLNGIEEKKGEINLITNPVSGYTFWKPGAYNNKDNSHQFQDSSTVETIKWGYLFYSKDKKLCEISLEKYSHIPYREIKIDRLITADEKELVTGIVRTVAPHD